MQPVFKDGSLESVEPYDMKRFNVLLKHTNVNHVRVFNQGGNKIGLNDIQEKDLELKVGALVDKKLEEQSGGRQIRNPFN